MNPFLPHPSFPSYSPSLWLTLCMEACFFPADKGSPHVGGATASFMFPSLSVALEGSAPYWPSHIGVSQGYILGPLSPPSPEVSFMPTALITIST